MTELSTEILGWWLVATVMGSLLNAFTYPWLRHWIGNINPSLRSMVRLLYAASAPLAALLAVVLTTQPAIAGFLIPTHCHELQCGMHTPVYAGGSVLLVGLASFASFIVLLMLAILLWALHWGHRRLRVLSAFSHRSGKGYRTLDSTDLLVCCAGLWRPKILVSQGLLDRLQPEELSIVLAHELAHAKRLDNLRALLQRWLTVFWPAPLNQILHSDSRADAEQACDLAAARAVVDPMRVASVIRKLSNFSSGTIRIQESRSVGFDCDDAATRITVLERGINANEPLSSGWFEAFFGLAVSWCMQICLLTAASHLMIEWVGSLVV